MSAGVAGWVKRYLPSEIAGALTAVAAGTAGSALSGLEPGGSIVVGAIAATIGENVGYYGVAGVREWRRLARVTGDGQDHLLVTGVLTGWSMLIEFGPAELVDTFLARPALMYLSAMLLQDAPIAWLIGKLAADVVFYAIVIGSYHASRRLLGTPDTDHFTIESAVREQRAGG